MGCPCNNLFRPVLAIIICIVYPPCPPPPSLSPVYTLHDTLFTRSHPCQMLPLSTNICEAYKNGKEDEQNFIQNLALFLCIFLKEHAVLIEQKPELQNTLLEVYIIIKSCNFMSANMHILLSGRNYLSLAISGCTIIVYLHRL